MKTITAMLCRGLYCVALIGLVTNAVAGDQPGDKPGDEVTDRVHAAIAGDKPGDKPGYEVADNVRAAIASMLPTAADLLVSPSPLPGINEVSVGMEVFYVSDDGQYVLGGPLIASAGRVNLTERRIAAARKQVLGNADDTRRFHYPAENAKHFVTIVTDIDCPYCRRLHNDMQGFQAAGIDVSYIMLPRAGKDSRSYKKTVNAACASDAETAITAAMRGEEPDNAICDHPIDNHMTLAQQLRISSTPSIILDDGRLVLGYHKPDDLLALIE